MGSEIRAAAWQTYRRRRNAFVAAGLRDWSGASLAHHRDDRKRLWQTTTCTCASIPAISRSSTTAKGVALERTPICSTNRTQPNRNESRPLGKRDSNPSFASSRAGSRRMKHSWSRRPCSGNSASSQRTSPPAISPKSFAPTAPSTRSCPVSTTETGSTTTTSVRTRTETGTITCNSVSSRRVELRGGETPCGGSISVTYSLRISREGGSWGRGLTTPLDLRRVPHRQVLHRVLQDMVVVEVVPKVRWMGPKLRMQLVQRHPLSGLRVRDELPQTHSKPVPVRVEGLPVEVSDPIAFENASFH